MRWISLLTAIAVAGCAMSRSPRDSIPSTDHMRLEIRNDGTLDAVIYAYWGGERYRLGLVIAHSTETFAFPLADTEDGQASLYIHRIGENDSRDFISNAVIVNDTRLAHAVFYLTADPGMSSLALFPNR